MVLAQLMFYGHEVEGGRWLHFGASVDLLWGCSEGSSLFFSCVQIVSDTKLKKEKKETNVLCGKKCWLKIIHKCKTLIARL